MSNTDKQSTILPPSAVQIPNGTNGVTIRRIPYPYRAILAICSDLDETPDRDVYFEIMRFLNTTQTTSMGPGLGLEIGNTIYFDMPPDQFAYWNTDDAGRAMVRALIRSGHIDCLHSFGDLATTRAHAGRALDELSRHDCRLEVWIDHGVAPSNFGADIMRGLGDVPDSPVYHADLSCGFGLQYVWRGRVTSVIGQDVPRSLRGIWNRQYPVVSARTWSKEFAKGLFARLGKEKYAMHGPNRVLREARLRSGQRVFEFLRSNPHWGGVSCGETADGLADVLRESVLAELVRREGSCILYTHMGKLSKHDELFHPRTRKALNNLARYSREGKILVTTTRRLLGYCRAIRDIAISTSNDSHSLNVNVTLGCPEEDIRGLSLYVTNSVGIRVLVNGKEVNNLDRNDPDHTGRPSVSIPWQPLNFPTL